MHSAHTDTHMCVQHGSNTFFTSGYQVLHCYEQHTFIFRFSRLLVSHSLIVNGCVCVCRARVCEFIFSSSLKPFISLLNDIYNVRNKKMCVTIVTQCDSHQTKQNGQKNIFIYIASGWAYAYNSKVNAKWARTNEGGRQIESKYVMAFVYVYQQHTATWM